MKSIFVLIPFLLQGGFIKGPFRVADAEPGHHQVNLQAAMAAGGHFAIAWIDSFWRSGYLDHYDLYIRFFDKDGNPLSDSYKILKPYDTTWVNYPSLDMDSAGKTVLVWTQDQTLSDTKLSKICYQRFAPDGNPVGSPKALYSDIDLGWPTPVSLANNGEFAIAFATRMDDMRGIWCCRFDLDGTSLDSAFLTHENLFDFLPDDTVNFQWPCLALNDTGDLVVTWLEWNYTSHMYPRFQMFDKDDKPILPWEPKGYRLDDGDSRAGACRPDPYWIDSNRFVVFWTDYCRPWPIPLVGRVFSERGAVKHPICELMRDSRWANVSDPKGKFCIAILADGRFAETHIRQYEDSSRTWHHAGGILGQVVKNEPWRRTTLFEYSAPFGSDTLFDLFHYDSPPAVAACNDRLVWVYSRLDTDTIFEAWAVISDWDMGEGASEKSPIARSDFEISNPIGREIVVRYWDCPQGFRAYVFDVSGRKVDELHSTERSGMIVWGECYGPGVYFIVPDGSKVNPLKVVLVR